MSPALSVCDGIPSVTSGAVLVPVTTTTSTPNFCSAKSPPGSVAVTVTVALPGATPMMVTVASETETVAKVVSELLAA